MDAFIVTDNTISAIVKAFEKYQVDYRAKDCGEEVKSITDRQEKNSKIGQSLVNQNYASFNYHYKENIKPHKYLFQDIEVDEDISSDCVEYYICQASETENFFKSEIYKSLTRLQAIRNERRFDRPPICGLIYEDLRFYEYKDDNGEDKI